MKARTLSLRFTHWVILSAAGLFCAAAFSGLLPTARMQEKKIASPVVIAPELGGGVVQSSFQVPSTPEASGTFPGTGLGAIADGAAGGTVCGDFGAPLNVSFAVSGISANITKVSVSFTASAPVHTWVGDLRVTLLAPGGAPSTNILSQTGSTTATGCGDDSDVGGPYTFASVAPAAPTWFGAAATATGAQQVASALYQTSTAGGVVGGGVNTSIDAAFTGLTPAQANGTWTLRFEDGGEGDTGAISAASLTVFQPSAAGGVVSGRISDGAGAAVAGTVVNLSGGQTRAAITDANGNYHFDNVDASGFYTVLPGRANYTFNPGSRSFSMVGNQTNTDFAGVFGGDTANPVDTSEYFVRQQYLDFLGRESDEGGLGFWSSQISQCGADAACIHQKRIDVSAAFFMSGEFQQSGSYVYDMYAGLLGRTPGYNEFTPDRAQVVGGTGLDAAKTAFAGEFVQRPEFISRYPQSMTREQFVDQVITTMQVRSGMFMDGLRSGLLADYDAGGRPIVVRHAAESSLFVSAEYNKAFVLMEYFGYLRRATDTGGYDFWLNVLNQGSGNNYRGMVCSFLTSTEYQGRFSSVIAHGNGECAQ